MAVKYIGVPKRGEQVLDGWECKILRKKYMLWARKIGLSRPLQTIEGPSISVEIRTGRFQWAGYVRSGQ